MKQMFTVLARVRFERPSTKVVRSDFLETEGEARPVDGKPVSVPTPRHSEVTLRVYL